MGQGEAIGHIFGDPDWHLHAIKARTLTLIESARALGLTAAVDSLQQSIADIEKIEASLREMTKKSLDAQHHDGHIAGRMMGDMGT